MKQVQVWPNHVRIPHLDLVFVRSADEHLDVTLDALSNMGIDTAPSNVEVFEGVKTG